MNEPTGRWEAGCLLASSCADHRAGRWWKQIRFTEVCPCDTADWLKRSWNSAGSNKNENQVIIHRGLYLIITELIQVWIRVCIHLCSVYVCLSVILIPLLRSQVQAPHDEGGVIVFNSAPSFHNQKEDFLSRRGKRGKGECVSGPVFLCSGSNRATVPL